jgi:hypothetical protein
MGMHGDALYVVGGDRSWGRTYRTTDGETWQVLSLAPYNFQNVEYLSCESFQGRLWLLGGSYEIEAPEGSVEDEEKQPYEGEYGEFLLNQVSSSPAGFGGTWESTEAQWPPRRMHASVVFQDKLWVLGGEAEGPSGRQYVNDIWHSSDGVSWVQATAAAAWAPRAGHAAAVYRGKVWVLGGYTGTNGLNDVWTSCDGADWIQVESSAPWKGRGFHACTVFQDKIWLIGGIDPVGVQSLYDIWTYFEAETEGGTEGDCEGIPVDHYHTADQNQNQRIDLSELLRVIQFYNLGDFRCAIPPESTEDGYAPGVGDTSCAPHDSDYAPQDWRIGLSELLRLIQFFNTVGYSYCPESGTEDGFCPAG